MFLRIKQYLVPATELLRPSRTRQLKTQISPFFSAQIMARNFSSSPAVRPYFGSRAFAYTQPFFQAIAIDLRIPDDLPTDWESSSIPYCGVSYSNLLSNISTHCAEGQKLQVSNNCWHYCTSQDNSSSIFNRCLGEGFQGNEPEWDDGHGWACNAAVTESSSGSCAAEPAGMLFVGNTVFLVWMFVRTFAW